MKLYVDTLEVEQVRELQEWGVFAGVTIHPKKSDSGEALRETLLEMANRQKGDIFVPICDGPAAAIEAEIEKLCTLIPSRLTIELPPSPTGLEVMRRLKDERIWTAAAPLVDFGQALLSLNAGADVLSLHFSEIRSRGVDPIQETDDIVDMCRHRGGRPRVLVTSLKDIHDLRAATRLGVWAAAIEPHLASTLLTSPPKNSGPIDSTREG